MRNFCQPGAIMGSKPAAGPGRPNPSKAHGAWIYLFVSVVSGTLIGTEHGVEPAMLVGTGFIGAFLVIAALSAGARRKRRQLLTGASLAVLSPLGAMWLNADPRFLVVAALAAISAVVAILLERKLGFLSRAALVAGVATLAFAAPVVAVAGGASVRQSVVVFGLLWPFFCWRTLRVAAPLRAGAAWDRAALRARGLQEAAIVSLWAFVVSISILALP